MGRLISIGLKCPGCKFDSTYKTRAPSLFSPAIFQTSCEYCESWIMFRLEKPKKAEKLGMQLKLHSQLIREGQKLIDLRAEEAAEKEQALKEFENARTQP